MASAADKVLVIGSQIFPLVQKQLRPKDYKPPFSRAKKVPRTVANYRVTGGNIAAIDFGTTSVSLAYTTKGYKMINTFILDVQEKAARDTNAVLFKREGKAISVAAFGNTARSQFTTMRKDENFDQEYIYFERIKMLLKREKNVDRQVLVESFSGEKFYLIEVIAFILQYLKDKLIGLHSRGATPLKTTDFDWVITVPAIWDARGKRMMREAAYMAGLLTKSKRISEFTPISSSPLPVPFEVNPDKLSLALEPEAAALYSQETVVEQIKGQPSAAAISRPTEYMVIDAGGGTIDITAHIEVDGGIVVQNIPSGNTWGGTQVNEAFSKLLQEIVSDPGFEKFIASGDHTKNRATLIKIVYIEFEKQKVLFGQGKIIKEIAVELPRNFVRFYEKVLVKQATKMSGTEFKPDDNDTLFIDESVTESKLFGPVIQGIIDCTLAAIDKIDNCPNTFYLVGAFGGCKYVHEKVSAAIKSHYQSKGHKGTCTVIVPPTPQLAVATGAAMWRKNPEKFKARRVDATYGIGASFPFDPKKHNEAYKYYNEEQKEYKCDYIFSIFLEKGELAKADEVVTITLSPRYSADTRMCINIYSTLQLGIQYYTDEKKKLIVTAIGKLDIDIPNPDNLPRSDRKVDITMDFSGTEIQAKAHYCVTGKEVKIVCDFLST
ncbi:PREDICTED: heat shock 70 kDa protein 12A-like [Amphimedon queenslandica]|uniref:Uncharacterized protein n=1 Tax=Amphimedon queenslandica TaxID=400682 RepID=A0A1X7VDQ0_AMPQE|nr:PREDICTED: heat shock 70 kDa protein 12A-like [Amphimedon queenslandica]|eukprot:XP_011402430.1 PREDICTED: heat shock 70 kDa protein 12A-like [Amphimedon queenslandica]